MGDRIGFRRSVWLLGLTVALVASEGCHKTGRGDAGQPSSGGAGGTAPSGGTTATHLSGGTSGSGAGGSHAEAGVVDAPTVDVGQASYTLFSVNVTTGFEIGALAVDETYVYWAQRGALVRRALDGRGAEEHIAHWVGTNVGGELAVDQDYVYWLDFGEWLRTPKAGGASVSLPLEAAGGDVAADERYAYAALIDCASVARVPHGGTTRESIYPAEPVTRSTGLTYLALDGDDLYCAGGHYVFVSHNWGPLELVTSDAVEVCGVIAVDREPYWFDQTATGSKTNLFHRSSDGEIQLLGTADSPNPPRPVVDPERRRLLFSKGGYVNAWSLDTGEYRTLIKEPGWSSYQVARDRDFFYWGRYTLQDARIERMPISRE